MTSNESPVSNTSSQTIVWLTDKMALFRFKGIEADPLFSGGSLKYLVNHFGARFT